MELNFIQNEQHFSKKMQGCWCKILRFFLDFGFIFVCEMVWIGCMDYRL
jgi:hypothetical protein